MTPVEIDKLICVNHQASEEYDENARLRRCLGQVGHALADCWDDCVDEIPVDAAEDLLFSLAGALNGLEEECVL